METNGSDDAIGVGDLDGSAALVALDRAIRRSPVDLLPDRKGLCQLDTSGDREAGVGVEADALASKQGKVGVLALPVGTRLEVLFRVDPAKRGADVDLRRGARAEEPAVAVPVEKPIEGLLRGQLGLDEEPGDEVEGFELARGGAIGEDAVAVRQIRAEVGDALLTVEEHEAPLECLLDKVVPPVDLHVRCEVPGAGGVDDSPLALEPNVVVPADRVHGDHVAAIRQAVDLVSVRPAAHHPGVEDVAASALRRIWQTGQLRTAGSVEAACSRVG